MNPLFSIRLRYEHGCPSKAGSRAFFLRALVLATCWLWHWPTATADGATIAAAANLQYVLDEVRALFSRETGKRIRITYGSSGNFLRQIIQGAPFEMFLSADENYVHTLVQKGLTEDGGTVYALGKIVLFTPRGAPVVPDPEMRGLAGAVAERRLKRFAIANPEHAPYGRAAREALLAAGLWDAIKGRLVLGENATQAAQFAASGSAQAGIIPYSLAITPAIARRGSYAVLPAGWHQPIRQRMVLLRSASDTARSLYAFLQQPPAQRILERYGFSLPNHGR